MLLFETLHIIQKLSHVLQKDNFITASFDDLNLDNNVPFNKTLTTVRDKLQKIQLYNKGQN